MNTTNEINSPTENNQLTYFKIQCNRRGIHISCPAPTPAEIIPIIQTRLAKHETHLAKHTDPRSGDYAEWKAIHDDLVEFLTELRAADSTASQPTASPAPSVENVFPTPEPGQNSQPIQPQQNSTRTEPGQTRMNPDKTQTTPETAQTKPAQTPDKPDNQHPIEPAAQEATAAEPAPKTPSAPEPPTDPDEPIIQSNDEELLEAAADYHARKKGRSRFDKLSAEQQSHILGLLEVHTIDVVRKLIAQPAPLGMSFKIGRSALNDFERRHKKREAERRKNESSKTAIELLNKSNDPNQAFAELFQRLLQIKALTAASDPTGTLETIASVNAILTKFRRQSLLERKQSFAEKTHHEKYL